LSAGRFNQRFRHSPVRRAKRRGYLRNIAVALGNQGNPESVAPLYQALLEDPAPLVRSHSAWALGRIGGVPARQALKKAFLTESDPQVMTAIHSALKD
jgi:epoxyqueuosine reductase